MVPTFSATSLRASTVASANLFSSEGFVVFFLFFNGKSKKRPQNDWGNETFIKSELFFSDGNLGGGKFKS